MIAPAPFPGRLAVVLSHPTQYYSPWFRFLAARGWNLRVFYLWDFGVTAQRDPEFGVRFQWDLDLLSGYAHEFVSNTARRPGTDRFLGLRNPTLRTRLRAYAPDVVLVFGYNYLTHLRLIFSARQPLVFRGDSHLLGRPALPPLKRLLLARLYARFAAITCVGAANRDYFRALGVPDSRLHFSPHCVDAVRFQPTPTLLAEAAALRRQLGLDGRRILLFAGKFVPSKQPRELLEAFFRAAPADAALVLVGDGPERPALEALVAAHRDRPIRLLPFANQTEMPIRYLLADLFALPSRGVSETWGLAVNEAMHLGVPCLVSDRVGCQRDLVTEGETGWVFRADQPGDLDRAIDRAFTDLAQRRESIRKNVSARIVAYSYEAAAAGLAAACTAACPRPRSAAV